MNALRGIEPPLRIALDAPMSLEDYFRFVEQNPDIRCERTATGELLLMSTTLGTASVFTLTIGRMLGNWADADGRGYVVDSDAICLLQDGSILLPDVAWVDGARWRPTSIEDDTPLPCPDFVIELRSKTDRLKPLQEKMGLWMVNGAKLGWLVDPREKTVEIYRPGKR